jgi:DNA polymerase delta subunit 2
LHSSLFLKLLKERKNVTFSTNPSCFHINDVKFIGTSGQTIKDIQAYTRLTDPLDIMSLTMRMRHLAPTCPDTLRSYPFIEHDPFVVTRFPHVYFCGNQDTYGAKFLVKNLKSADGHDENQCIKLVSVPRFRESASIVVMDMASLKTFEVKLEGRDAY